MLRISMFGMLVSGNELEEISQRRNILFKFRQKSLLQYQAYAPSAPLDLFSLPSIFLFFTNLWLIVAVGGPSYWEQMLGICATLASLQEQQFLESQVTTRMRIFTFAAGSQLSLLLLFCYVAAQACGYVFIQLFSLKLNKFLLPVGRLI